jgi:hypothetical protein
MVRCVKSRLRCASRAAGKPELNGKPIVAFLFAQQSTQSAKQSLWLQRKRWQGTEVVQVESEGNRVGPRRVMTKKDFECQRVVPL